MNTPTTITDPRQERGLKIAQTAKIVSRRPGVFLVPSEAQPKYSYTVIQDASEDTCTCPDFELRQSRCKHGWAAFYSRSTEMLGDGSMKVVETKRVTYSQPWSQYNAAQTSEVDQAADILRALCDGYSEARHPKPGRQQLPLSDRLFAVCWKAYRGLSARRGDCDMKAIAAKGHLSKAPSWNAVLDYFDDATLIPLLTTLIEESAKPLRMVESNFAIDSTGFSTSTHRRWFDHKYGREMSEQNWLKLHAMIGTRTNVITAAVVTDGYSGDPVQLIPLLNATAHNFDVAEVSADKAYSSVANLTAIEAAGAKALIPFKSNATAIDGRGNAKPEVWTRLLGYFQFQRADFLAHYHRRSNVETTFSMMKRVLGPSLRSKSRVAQEVELLAKTLMHNIRCIVHATHELGIVTHFWETTTTTVTPPAPEPVTVHPTVQPEPAWVMIDLPDVWPSQ